ncbi:hypothetical protein GKC56_06645 [Neisseriaceae bacterium PsAf]|nr:hypothetical protein [Neisseriaceae bacterium PsAf]
MPVVAKMKMSNIAIEMIIVQILSFEYIKLAFKINDAKLAMSAMAIMNK